MRYKCYLKAIPLKESLDLMDNNRTVFYSYSVNKPIWALTEDCLSAAIRNDAMFFTTDSMLIEETEVKKDKLWAKFKIREELESWWGVEGGIDEDGIKNVLNIIDQLNEPEVLSQEWVDNNVVHVRGLGDIIEAESVENIIVPNKELPVIPQFISNWIEENRERYENNFFSIGQDLYNDCIQTDVSDWLMENEEKFVRAWFGAYEIED